MCMPVSMTLMLGHSGSAKAKNWHWIIWTTKQAISIKFAATVCHCDLDFWKQLYLYSLTNLFVLIWFDCFDMFLLPPYRKSGERCIELLYHLLSGTSANLFQPLVASVDKCFNAPGRQDCNCLNDWESAHQLQEYSYWSKSPYETAIQGICFEIV